MQLQSTKHPIAFRSSFALRFGATLGMLIGSVLVFGLLLSLNASGGKKDKSAKRKPVTFSVQKKRKPPKKRKRRVRRKRIQRQNTPKVSRPQLAAALSGFSFGLPSMDIGFDDASKDLLGKTQDLNKLVMTEKTVDHPPSARQRVAPGYPPRARAKGITGYVSFRILIGTQGEVQEAEIQTSHPPGVFDVVATNAIRRWSFQPAMYKGQPVRVWAHQTLRFELR